jgi:sporulation protein YlmC with PRC-barrel domain
MNAKFPMKTRNKFIPTLTAVFSLAMCSALYAQYQGQPQAERPDSGVTERGEQTTPLDTGAQVKPQKINKASALIGMKVRNAQNEDLGKIKDIVIDLDQGRVAYAVLSTSGGGIFGLREKLVAVPAYVLRAETGMDHLVLNASKAKLEAARGFDSENYPAMQSSAWGAEPFWDTEGIAPRDTFPTIPKDRLEEPRLPEEIERPQEHRETEDQRDRPPIQ